MTEIGWKKKKDYKRHFQKREERFFVTIKDIIEVIMLALTILRSENLLRITISKVINNLSEVFDFLT